MSSLPARLDQARDLAVVAEITKRDARYFELAIVGTRTAGDFAAVADADLGRVARHGGKLELSAEALLHRLGLIPNDRPERSPVGTVLVGKLAAPVVLLRLASLCPFRF